MPKDKISMATKSDTTLFVYYLVLVPLLLGQFLYQPHWLEKKKNLADVILNCPDAALTLVFQSQSLKTIIIRFPPGMTENPTGPQFLRTGLDITWLAVRNHVVVAVLERLVGHGFGPVWSYQTTLADEGLIDPSGTPALFWLEPALLSLTGFPSSCRSVGKLLLLWWNSSIKIQISAFSGGISTCLLLQSCPSLSLPGHEKGETRYLFRNLWSLTPHYLTAESLQAARRPVTLRRFVTPGLAGLHPFSDALAECLRHCRDCQSYLSQLCLAIRLAAPSVAFSFCCPRQMVPVQPLVNSFY